MSKLVVQATILENAAVAPLVKKIVLHVPAIALQAKPGQFVHLKASENIHPLLRRPYSIADADVEKKTITLIYRIVGEGTALLAKLEAGAMVNCMGPLGHGFELTGNKPLLVGGGMGVAPLLYLARSLCPRPSEIIMGGRTQTEMFWPELFRSVCENIHITTDDGSLGQRGTVLNILPEIIKRHQFDIIYTCGPRVMMEEVARAASASGIPCQVSLEAHMACGVGACLSCTCAGTDGIRRKVCGDGPVFWAQEVF